MSQRKGHILILVENLPVPFDRRVWMESMSLTEAGYKVSVISPCPPEELHEPDEVRARVLEQARGLFPRLVRQPAAEARLVELREWAGEHHYAVRIEVVHESSGGPTLSFPLVLLLPPLVLPVVASNEVRATAVVYDPAGDSEWEVESVVTAGAVLWLPMLIPIDPGAFWEPLDLAVADCLRQLGRLYLW